MSKETYSGAASLVPASGQTTSKAHFKPHLNIQSKSPNAKCMSDCNDALSQNPGYPERMGSGRLWPFCRGGLDGWLWWLLPEKSVSQMRMVPSSEPDAYD